jgi:type II secretory pathway component GspD/PulD (secretin)
MRLQLSDGTFLDASLLSATSRSSSRRQENAPSKRQVKNKGGSLKRHNSRTSASNVGGTKNSMRATYVNFEVDPTTGSVIINRSLPRPTCVTVNEATRNYTWELGGSTPSPFRGGKGI